ncbi:hypothetical protein EVAR_98938_1 [Eumeta japonica]|uniref:Uncharacterized protein n=1 Tax=Eumeta variegata TaxID=151549 RepID=A0A4C1TBL3_EUMVA|nr:hypothetical protein EVAR_98938_1 [Eumeta japonica]
MEWENTNSISRVHQHKAIAPLDARARADGERSV